MPISLPPYGHKVTAWTGSPIALNRNERQILKMAEPVFLQDEAEGIHAGPSGRPVFSLSIAKNSELDMEETELMHK